MVRSQDQVRVQFAIECPEEELHALRRDRLCVHGFAWLKHAGEGCPKEVEVVLLKTPPDANILRQVFSKLHQDMCEGLTLSAREMERVIRQGTLGFGEEPGQLLSDFRQGAFAASKPLLGAMGTKIHKGTSPLATRRNV